jgi:hypothetical protein
LLLLLIREIISWRICADVKTLDGDVLAPQMLQPRRNDPQTGEADHPPAIDSGWWVMVEGWPRADAKSKPP